MIVMAIQPIRIPSINRFTFWCVRAWQQVARNVFHFNSAMLSTDKNIVKWSVVSNDSFASSQKIIVPTDFVNFILKFVQIWCVLRIFLFLLKSNDDKSEDS